MSGLVTCGWCLQVVAADGVHSCFDAKKVADHRAAERAVLDAAKALEPLVNDTGWSRGLGYDCTVTMSGRNGFDLHNALTALLEATRALTEVTP